MSAAIDYLQWRHDNAEPECEDKFIDTQEGDAWATYAAEDLMACKPLMIGTKQVIKPFALAEAVGEAVSNAHDPDDNYSAMILYTALGDGEKAKACFEAFMGKKYVENLAYQMVAQHADEYAKSLKDEHDDL